MHALLNFEFCQQHMFDDLMIELDIATIVQMKGFSAARVILLCSLLVTLLASPDAVGWLEAPKLIRQPDHLATSLEPAELPPQAPPVTNKPLDQRPPLQPPAPAQT